MCILVNCIYLIQTLNQPGFINQELLGLAHLKKLYSEYSHPPHPLSAAGQDKDNEKDKGKENRQKQIQQHHLVCLIYTDH